jgi:polysaccharide export outer membrane protein
MGSRKIPPAMRKLPPLFLLASLCGCGSWETVPDATPGAEKAFSVPDKSFKPSANSAIEAFRTEKPKEYRLGDGDQLSLEVIGRPELSGQHVIGPDGRITLPIAGSLFLRDLTREEAGQAVTRHLSRYYKDVYTNLRVDKYTSNRIIILGRVENPGVVEFDSPPTLLEILAKSGGLPILRPEQVLTRCSVIRGDKIIFLDLKRLMAGDLSLNIPLQRNDVVNIPDAFDTSIFVLGAVEHPGSYRLTQKMSLLDAIGQAGGTHIDANPTAIHVIRPATGQNLEVDMDTILAGDPRKIVALEEGDIVFVPRNTIAKIGYVLQKLNPFAQVFAIRQLAAMP